MSRHDFRFIKYFLDKNGRTWSGPYAPEDNLHYGALAPIMTLSRSEPSRTWVEISPQQAALHLHYQHEGYTVSDCA